MTQKRRKYLKISGIAVVGLLGVALLGWLIFQQWYNNNLVALDSASTESTVITIDEGESASMIAQELKEKDIIRNARAFELYVSKSGHRANLQAGVYKFGPSMSVQRIVEMLANGEVDTSYITLLPGKRLDETRQVLIDAGYDAAEVDEALQPDQYRDSHSSLRSLPQGATLEGYIYPETFQRTATTTPKQIVDLSLSELDTLLTTELEAQIVAQGLTLHEGIILASIVEEEVKDPDKPTVAQVFLRRLNEDIALGSDVTFYYAAKVTGQEASPRLDSPYNTRRYKGLPPGPIANFRIKSLEAVANPSETDYLYFLSGDDGKTYYGHTLAEHESNIEQHCQENCQL